MKNEYKEKIKKFALEYIKKGIIILLVRIDTYLDAKGEEKKNLFYRHGVRLLKIRKTILNWKEVLVLLKA